MGFQYAAPIPIEDMPSTVISGTKGGIDGAAGQWLVPASVPIRKGVLLRLDELNGGDTYVAFGSGGAGSHHFKLTTVGSYMWVDWIDDLRKISVISDSAGLSVVSWIGG